MDGNKNASLIMALSSYLEALSSIQAPGSQTYVNREIKTTIELIEELKQGK